MNRAAGIDLGTTFSSIATINDKGEPEIVPNAEGGHLTPSIVFFDGDVVVVGEIAKDNVEVHPEKVAMFVKREMGNHKWYFKYNNKRTH